MDWTLGYSASWSVHRVNSDTWADEGEIGGIGAISVSRSSEDSVRLLETATMQVEESLDTGWYRVYMLADQGGVEKVPVCTMLFEQIRSRTDHGKVATARGRSVLQPAADVKMPRGGYTPAGFDAAKWARDMLAPLIPAPIEVDGSFSLAEDYAHAPNTSVLAAVWKVLDAGGFCMRVTGEGIIRIGPLPEEPAITLDKAHAGLLVPGVDDDFDLTGIPNRYVAVFGNEVYEARNERADSKVGFPQRGRWVYADIDESPSPRSDESRQAYVERRLAELSTVTRKFSYTREFWPEVGPYDVVSASLASNGVEGELRVISQSVARDHGAVVTETAGLEVRL